MNQTNNSETFVVHFQSRIVPVVTLTDVNHAVPLALALLDGGIDVIEVTLRTSQALACIERIAKDVPQMHLGAGTVCRAADMQAVKNSGAAFALSPGCTAELVDAAQSLALPFIPGVMTPTEVMAARNQGYSLMKLFPASVAGGVDMLKAMAGPLGDVRFCPTGGVNITNLQSFLKLGNVAFVGGSWLSPQSMMQAGDWAGITNLAKQAVAASRQD